MKLRTFQSDLKRLAKTNALRDGSQVVLNATPGAGKTLGAALYAKPFVDAGYQVMYVTPWRTLVYQVAGGVRQVGFELRALEDNRLPFVDPGSSHRGYCATKSLVESNPQAHIAYAQQGRTLLIVDEFHHATGGDDPNGFGKVLSKLTEHTEHVLLMTGTMARHDRRPIWGLTYSDGAPAPADVTYTRVDALRDRAKLAFVPEWYEGVADWDVRGDEVQSRISDPVGSTWALTQCEEFAEQACYRATEDWLVYRRTHPKSQMLVAVSGQDLARLMIERIGGWAPGARVGLAVSDDGAASSRNCRRFRRRDLDVLVSVQMAYEGFDAPGVSHLVILRGFESVPYLEQAIDRATRIDPLDPRKEAAIYLPGTPGTRAAVAKILASEGPARLREPSSDEGAGSGDGGEASIRCVGASIDGVDLPDALANDLLARLAIHSPGVGGPRDELLRLALALEDAGSLPELPAPPAFDPEQARQECRELAARIDRACIDRRQTYRGRLWDWGDWNRVAKGRLGRGISREDSTQRRERLEFYRDALSHLEEAVTS